MLHGRASATTIVLGAVARLAPFGATVLVAYVMSKKAANAVASKIRGTMLPCGGHDDGIREDNSVVVHTALKVTQQLLAV